MGKVKSPGKTIRELKRKIKDLEQKLIDLDGAYQFLWKMRIQDEKERRNG